NEWLFRRHVRRILADERIDLFVYGLSHKAVGLPPFDVAVPRVFDYLDLCLYPGVEDAYLANSDLVLCTSTVLVERVRARGVRAAYLPNGVDRGRLASGKAEAVRRALGLTGKRVVSLIGLTCSPTLFFVDAIARARHEMPDLASFDWDVLAARFEESCEALLSERASTRAASAQVRRGEVLDERPVPSSPV